MRRSYSLAFPYVRTGVHTNHRHIKTAGRDSFIDQPHPTLISGIALGGIIHSPTMDSVKGQAPTGAVNYGLTYSARQYAVSASTTAAEFIGSLAGGCAKLAKFQVIHHFSPTKYCFAGRTSRFELKCLTSMFSVPTKASVIRIMDGLGAKARDSWLVRLDWGHKQFQ